MKIKDERLENQDRKVIIRSFVVLTILLLGFVIFYGKNDFLSTVSPNLVIFFILLITVLYSCLDFYISGTLLPDVEDKHDIKVKTISIIEGLLSINGLGLILYLLNNTYTPYSIIMVIISFLLIDLIILVITTILLFLWLKIISTN